MAKSKRSAASCVALAFYLASAAVVVAGDGNQFTGTWVANGTRKVLPPGTERQPSLFTVSRHVNLDGPVLNETDFWSECVGLADTETGIEARCVWRSLSGQEIYLQLQSTGLRTGSHVSGTLIGGTDRAEAIEGTISFDWETMILQRENTTFSVSGYAKNLQGSYSLGK